MLKIKDNIDLKELEKYKIKPRYDEYTWKIKYFISEKQICVLNPVYFKTIFYKENKNYILDYKCTYFKDYNYKVDIDLLYDLTKADLVEKVGDN